MIRAMLHRLFGCSHEHAYRQRKELHGLQVMHFVCPDCGHATEVLQRTAEEHQAMLAQGRIRALQAKQPQPVTVAQRARILAKLKV